MIPQTTRTPKEISRRLKEAAGERGFALAGIRPAAEPAGLGRLFDWLAAGYAGEMRYLETRRDAYAHPTAVLEGARSLVLLAMPYRTVEPGTVAAGEGRVARYAWGRDYHDVIHERLRALAADLQQLAPGAVVRGVVDTAPLLERELAQVAGLGWVGKNTLLLNRNQGSYFFLAALLTDAELAADEPFGADHCGTCTACLEACPTGAFVEPYVLDARRCISYLTIEHRTAIPVELRSGIGDWVFGCDVCQEVCPWNRKSSLSSEPEFSPRGGETNMSLRELFDLDEAAFRGRYRGTPLARPKRRGLLRNAAIVLGNQRDPASVPALVKGLNDAEPLVRGASAWALGQIGDDAARDALIARHVVESDCEVLGEIDLALSNCSRGL